MEFIPSLHGYRIRKIWIHFSLFSSPARACHDKKEKKIRPCYLSLLPLPSSLRHAVASAAMKWFLSAVHLFPPSSSSLFRVAARVSLRGAGPMGPMDGTEKFRLGAGSQVVYTPPVHYFSFLPFPSYYSTLCPFCDALDFSSSPLLSPLCLSLFFGKEIDEVATVRTSFLHVRTSGIDRNPSYRRIAADTHAPRGYPAGTVHRMPVYRVYRLTSRTLLRLTDHLPAIWTSYGLRENFIKRNIVLQFLNIRI